MNSAIHTVVKSKQTAHASRNYAFWNTHKLTSGARLRASTATKTAPAVSALASSPNTNGVVHPCSAPVIPKAIAQPMKMQDDAMPGQSNAPVCPPLFPTNPRKAAASARTTRGKCIAEGCTPSAPGRDRAGEKCAERQPDSAANSKISKCALAIRFLREGRGEGRWARGGNQCAPDTLQQSARHQYAEGGRKDGGERCEREHHRAQQEQRSLPDAVGERTERQEQSSEAEDESVQNPLQRRDTYAKLDLNLSQRDSRRRNGHGNRGDRSASGRQGVSARDAWESATPQRWTSRFQCKEQME
jgi:hypothetical protein